MDFQFTDSQLEEAKRLVFSFVTFCVVSFSKVGICGNVHQFSTGEAEAGEF